MSSINLKDEGHRLGLGSFKALGGSYAVIRLILEEVIVRLGRAIDPSELHIPEVKDVARAMTVSCATDGNHGRSVAHGAQLIGANCVIFVHSGVSEERTTAFSRFGKAFRRFLQCREQLRSIGLISQIQRPMLPISICFGLSR